jgi:hypothetical protein
MKYLAVVLLVACGGSAPPPKSADLVASDPETGGEDRSDPCTGGEIMQEQIARGGENSDPCTGGEADGLGSVGRTGTPPATESNGGAGGGRPIEKPAQGYSKLGPATITGKIKHVPERMEAAQKHLGACYDSYLATAPGASYSTVLAFEITKTGAPKDVTSTATTPVADLDNCLVRVVEGLTFEAPTSGTVTVSYPISFTP